MRLSVVAAPTACWRLAVAVLLLLLPQAMQAQEPKPKKPHPAQVGAPRSASDHLRQLPRGFRPYRPAERQLVQLSAAPSPSPGALVSEVEPNDSVVTANALALGDTVSGAIDPAGDVDFYAVTLTAGEWVAFDVDAQSLAGGSDLDSWLALYDPTGDSIVAWNDDWDGLDSYLLFAAPADGIYFLEVSPCCGPGPGPGGPGSVYELGFTAFTLAVTEVEPNDVPNEATVVTLGDTSVLAVIEPATDIDYFAIDVTSDGVLLVEWLAVNWWFPAIVKLWDTDGTTLLDSANTDFGDLSVRTYVAVAGRYYVSVEDAYQDPGFLEPRLYGLTNVLVQTGPGDPTTFVAADLGWPDQVVADWEGNILIRDVDAGRLLQVDGNGSVSVLDDFSQGWISSVAVDGFGAVLVSGYDNQTGISGLWHLGSGGTRTMFTPDTAGVYGFEMLEIGPDGDVWASACTTQACPALMHFDPLGNLQSTTALPVWPRDMAFAPSGELHFTDGYDGIYRVEGSTATRVVTAEPYVEGLAFDQDGYFYVSNGFIGRISLYLPTYNLEDVNFAITNLSGPILLVFGRTAEGATTSRLFATNAGWDDVGLQGTMVEMNPAGMRAPGAPVGAQLLRVATVSLKSGVIGADYADTLQLEDAPGAAVTWSVIEGTLPPGLSLDAATGIIAGVPTADGTYDITMGVTAGGQRGFATFTIVVGEPTIAASDAIDAALGVEGAITPASERFLDIRGNNNGRFDIGDVRAHLQATGVLAPERSVAARGKER